MRSVADDLRRELRARVAALSSTERVELAFNLGEEDLATFAAASGLDRAAATRELQRRRQRSRRPSACIESLLR